MFALTVSAARFSPPALAVRRKGALAPPATTTTTPSATACRAAQPKRQDLLASSSGSADPGRKSPLKSQRKMAHVVARRAIMDPDVSSADALQTGHPDAIRRRERAQRRLERRREIYKSLSELEDSQDWWQVDCTEEWLQRVIKTEYKLFERRVSENCDSTECNL
mmetsp:Transcript_5497/g.11704  ORF Transcript_5497/g.11704 Transcript_5497/m.11704 type:complete len:165 (-) Transcript_5497:165-659(-)